jgi:thiopeptide-type bacteriocin biosynthesis protein
MRTEQRTFVPGSEWLYLKIYTGVRTADSLLVDILHPVSLATIDQKIADRWFFIRYADPDFHIRYRLRLTDEQHVGLVMPMLKDKMNAMLGSGLIWKIETATYQREIERYGSMTIDLAEKLFYLDTFSFLEFMNEHKEKNDVNDRWLYAILAVDSALQDFNISLEGKKKLLLELNRSFGKEFGKDKLLARQLSEKFRNSRERINALLSEGEDAGSMHYLKNILRRRTFSEQKCVNTILDHYKKEEVEVPMNDFLSSLIHMSMNRIFRSNSRMHEMVIYDFLFRHYKGKTHRMLLSEKTG